MVERAGGLFLNGKGRGFLLRLNTPRIGLPWTRTAFMIPSDIPTLESVELDKLIASHSGSNSVTLVPDRHYGGTNGLIVSPPGIIDYHFGSDSFSLHLEATEKALITPTVKISPGIALDIDSQTDLYRLLTVEQQLRL